MNLGLIDRLQLMVFPLILGQAGKEPIYADYPRVPLELMNTNVLDSRLILLVTVPQSEPLKPPLAEEQLL
jgi:hypothetical protein